jgi:hypothetical protein
MILTLTRSVGRRIAFPNYLNGNEASVSGGFRQMKRSHILLGCAFDLLELDGMDLRREPIEVRKHR